MSLEIIEIYKGYKIYIHECASQGLYLAIVGDIIVINADLEWCKFGIDRELGIVEQEH